MAREAASPDDHRTVRRAVETMGARTLELARSMPETVLHEQVDGEYSFVQTQRHLLFTGDAWLGNAVLEEAASRPTPTPTGSAWCAAA